VDLGLALVRCRDFRMRGFGGALIRCSPELARPVGGGEPPLTPFMPFIRRNHG
jgi:hypothetical protein